MYPKILSCLLIVLSAISASGGELIGAVSFSPGDLLFSKVDGYDLVTLADNPLTGEVGRPMLPVVNYRVVIPPTAEMAEVEVLFSQPLQLTGRYLIYPAQEPKPISSQKVPSLTEPDETIYSSSNPYPATISQGVGTGSMGGYRIATVHLHPLQYVPSERALRLHTRIELRIIYREGGVNPKPRTDRQNRVFGESVEGLVSNPEDVERWSPPLRTWPKGSKALPPGDYEYVIIAPQADSSTFSPLSAWKMKKGVPATIVTREYIYSNYSGANNQERIKNFIRDASNTWGTIWVVLGGDVAWIPYRGCYGYVESSPPEQDNNIPCDRYWEDLDNNWNYDGDSRYGETSDGPGGGDIDMYADVYVGRLSCDNSQEVQRVLDHILLYEKNPPSGYLPKIVYFSEYLFGSKNGKDICEDLIEPVIPASWVTTKRYNENGWYASDDQAVGDMNQGYGFNMIGSHGNTSSVMAGSGSSKNITVSDLAALLQPGNKRGIHTGICCLSGDFSTGTCYAEQLLNDADSKIAGCIFNSRYGWGTPSGGVYAGSARLSERLFIEIFNNNRYHLGQALAEARDYYVSSARGHSGWQGVYRWIIFCYNLIGDPELPLWTDTPGALAVDHPAWAPTGPSNFVVTVNSGDAPTRGALVCVMKTGEVYEHDITNSAGQVTLPISPVTTGTMDVTVTAKNHLPYEGTATVAARRDVGVLSIDAPADTVDTSSVHTPRVTVENVGDSTETFQVGCWFDSSGTTVYADTQWVSDLAPGAQTEVSFTSWTACGETGVTYQLTVTTLLSEDIDPGNDSRQKTVTTILNHDVGTISIDAPPDSVHSDFTYTPQATVRNYGDVLEDFQVACWFDSSGITVYADTQTVTGLGSGAQAQVSFADWTACSGGSIDYQITVSTVLIGDSDPANDAQQKTVTTMEYHDVGTTSIEAPPDTVHCDSTYVPQALVRNFGNMTEDFTVFCTIGDYADTVQVVAVPPDSTHLAQFATWTVPAGDSTTYLVTVTTLLPGDLDPANDTQEKEVFAYRVGIQELGSFQFPISSFQLSQNSPNPFGAGGTSISFNVKRSTLNVSLRVYDLSGRLVRTLADDPQEPGCYNIVWDGRDTLGRRVSPGVYFYRFVAGDCVLTKKMALLQ